MMTTRIERIRRRLNLTRQPAVLGDMNGTIYSERRDLVYVRYVAADGRYSPAHLVRYGGIQEMRPGNPVWVGVDFDGQAVILGPRIVAQLESGFDPARNNPAASHHTQGKVTLADLHLFTVSSTYPKSLSVAVFSLIWLENGTLYHYAGEDKPLGSYVPDPGEHRLVALFLKPDNTIQATVSASQPTVVPLGLDDVNECLALAADGAKPSKFLRLDNTTSAIDAETGVSEGGNLFLDARQFINGEEGVGRTLVTASTYTVLKSDRIIGVNYAGTVNIPLLAASAVRPGRTIFFKDESGGASGNLITVQADGTDTIDGAPDATIDTDYGSLALYSNGVDAWCRVAEGGGGGTPGVTVKDSDSSVIVANATEIRVPDGALVDVGGGVVQLKTVQQMAFTIMGLLLVEASPVRLYNCLGGTRTITKVFAYVGTAPTGANILIDIHKSGTTIFTNQAHRCTINAAANTGSTTTIDVADWAADEYLEMYVDQVGSTVAGSNLTVHVVFEG